MTCHLDVKHSQSNPKIDSLTNSRLENSNMAFIFQIDNVLINYSWNADILSFGGQTISKYSENWLSD